MKLFPFLRLLAAAALGLLFLWPPSPSHAENATGYAMVSNGDINSAREAARLDAMRTFVEKHVGVYVDSQTEVLNYELVSDFIMAKSSAYVQVNRVVREKNDGNVYTIVLDLTVSPEKIRTAPQDLRAAIDQIPTDSNRHSVMVAVSGKDEYGRVYSGEDFIVLNSYLADKMESLGFRPGRSDAVRMHLAANAGRDYGSLDIELRRILRNDLERTNDSILTGYFSTIEILPATGGFAATVRAAFSLIGTDSDTVNTHVRHTTAIGPTRNAALEKARMEASRQASEEIARKALSTVQDEYRGGRKNIRIAVRFHNVTNQAAQRPQIVNALKNSGCRIIRSAMRGTTFTAFVETMNYPTIGELGEAVMRQGAAFGLEQSEKGENEYGSNALVFSF